MNETAADTSQRSVFLSSTILQLLEAIVLVKVTWLILDHVKKWKRKCRLLEALPCVKPKSKLLYNISNVYASPKVPKREHILHVWHTIQDIAKAHHSKHGGFILTFLSPYYLPFLSKSTLFLTDYELVAQAMNHPKLQSKGTQYAALSVFTKDSILGAPTNDDWKRMRKLTSKAFSNHVMNSTNEISHSMMASKVYPFLDQLAKEGKEIDVKDFTSPLTLDILGRVAFSYSVGGLDMLLNKKNHNDDSTSATTTKSNGSEKKELYQVFSEISEDLQILIRLRKFLPEWIIKFLILRRFNPNVQLLNDTITDVLYQRRSEAIKNEEKKDDLLGYLLEKDERGDPILSTQELLGNTRVFLAAGNDTTAISITFALYEISRKPDILQKLRLEVDPLFFQRDDVNKNAFPSYGELRNCSYLCAVIREVLRLHAPAVIARVAKDSAEITLETSKHTLVIPADTNINVAPWLTHRLDATAPDEDPLAFDPDRTVTKSDAYFPFAVGLRNCVGRELALAEMRAVIACMVHTYDFEPPTEEVVTFMQLTLTPNQCKMKFQRRKR